MLDAIYNDTMGLLKSGLAVFPVSVKPKHVGRSAGAAGDYRFTSNNPRMGREIWATVCWPHPNAVCRKARR